MNAYKFLPTLALVFPLVVAPVEMSAQQTAPTAKLDPRTIKFERVAAPRATDARNQNLTADWYKVEAQFATMKELTTEIRVRCFVDGADAQHPEIQSNPPAATVILTAEETFTNIPMDRNHFVVFYLHPMSIKRYAGGRDERGIIRDSNARFELYEDGQLVDAQEIKPNYPENWFTMATQINDILLSVTRSPWWPADYVRYNQIKPRP